MSHEWKSYRNQRKVYHINYINQSWSLDCGGFISVSTRKPLAEWWTFEGLSSLEGYANDYGCLCRKRANLHCDCGRSYGRPDEEIWQNAFKNMSFFQREMTDIVRCSCKRKEVCGGGFGDFQVLWHRFLKDRLAD